MLWLIKNICFAILFINDVTQPVRAIINFTKISVFALPYQKICMKN